MYSIAASRMHILSKKTVAAAHVEFIHAFASVVHHMHKYANK